MANLSQEKRQRMLEFLHKIKEEYKDDDSILSLHQHREERKVRYRKEGTL